MFTGLFRSYISHTFWLINTLIIFSHGILLTTIPHRETTQGPPKTLGGKSLSHTELEEKWKYEEAHAKRNQLLADYQKKERRSEFQRQERAREEKEIQEKKSRAREIATKQDRTERDRTAAHGEVVKQKRLQHFNSYPPIFK